MNSVLRSHRVVGSKGRGDRSPLVPWKWSLLEQAEPPAALYRLHVLEVAALEVSSRRVFADPECLVCGEAG